MARPINRLSARAVQTTTKTGYHADGGGLYLLVGPTGAKSWVFRYQFQGRRREMGLGPAAVVSLQEARMAALAQRKVLVEGRDPIEVKRLTLGTAPTFGECAAAYIASQRVGWRNDAQANQWEQSLRDYGPDPGMPVDRVTTDVVMSCLMPIWTTKTETANRVRGRIERILDSAKVRGHRDGENPARWRGHLDKLLPKPSAVATTGHHSAMPFLDLPAFMAQLRERDNRSRRGLAFVILTAARTEEVTGANWPEFDLDRRIWTVPAGRMKGKREHIVPLSDAAVAILQGLPRNAPPFSMSENTMLYLVQRAPPKGFGLPYTVHGFRSAFRDWAAETTDFPGEVVEMALAHKIRNRVEAAYRRGALIEKRRELMAEWAAYCLGLRDVHAAPSPNETAQTV
ncbi:MAG: integrase arm-type DNA-binding domain-containing protein [Xanthomonadaceae bacterium]|jgi:integrase|nr:integrase arm-type DNA-binding domain-containing protein [Xanthomonadaceae bacterium]